VPAQKIKATFTEPMLLLPARTLPEGANWAYKLDGYRALVIKTNDKVHLRSRNNKDFNTRYPAVAKALAPLPDETVIDGELVALDESGRRCFNHLAEPRLNERANHHLFCAAFAAMACFA
jgi:ATP-dependent DNA ligase